MTYKLTQFQRVQSLVKSSFTDQNNSSYIVLHDDSFYLSQSERLLSAIAKEFCPDGIFIPDKKLRDMLTTIARTATKKKKVFYRVAMKTGDNGQLETLYINLNNNENIKVSKDGWLPPSDKHIDDDAAIVSNLSSQDIPYPAESGSVDLLKEVINFKSDDDFKIILAWIVYSFFPGDFGSKAILIINGRQGSGKSKATTFLKQLIDPDSSPIITLTDDVDIMLIASQTQLSLWLIKCSSLWPQTMPILLVTT